MAGTALGLDSKVQLTGIRGNPKINFVHQVVFNLTDYKSKQQTPKAVQQFLPRRWISGRLIEHALGYKKQLYSDTRTSQEISIRATPESLDIRHGDFERLQDDQLSRFLAEKLLGCIQELRFVSRTCREMSTAC